jgi:hypothetical protein
VIRARQIVFDATAGNRWVAYMCPQEQAWAPTDALAYRAGFCANTLYHTKPYGRLARFDSASGITGRAQLIVGAAGITGSPMTPGAARR